MTLLLVCPTCGIERVVETLEYEPRPVWTSATGPPLAGRSSPLELGRVITRQQRHERTK